MPLNGHTRGLVNAARLALMKPDGTLLNFARGGIVDDAAVIAALNAGRLHAYVCDFPNVMLKDHPQVVTLPHLGASTGEAEENCAIMVAEQVRDFLENGNIKNSVNPGGGAAARAQHHAPGDRPATCQHMVGQTSTSPAAARLNIADLLNKSRGEYAHTLIDTDGAVNADVLGELRAIEGAVRAPALKEAPESWLPESRRTGAAGTAGAKPLQADLEACARASMRWMRRSTGFISERASCPAGRHSAPPAVAPWILSPLSARRVLVRAPSTRGPLRDEEVLRLFREIMSACLAQQEPPRGLPGSGRHLHADRGAESLGHSARHAAASIDEVFHEGGRQCRLRAWKPIENSTGGHRQSHA